MGNELAVAETTIEALDAAAAKGMLAQGEESPFKRAFMVAQAIAELRALLTPKVMAVFMKLQNTSIGFKTDNPAGYSEDVVRDCIIEARLKGVYPIGNEFNIISKQCYITKEGYFHKLRDLPNFSWIEVPAIPRIAGDSGAIDKVKLEWTLNKQKFERELELAIRVNRGMGADAIIGKALRKARAWLYTTVTGQEIGDGDVEGGIVDVTPEAVKSPFEEKPVDVNAEESGDQLPM